MESAAALRLELEEMQRQLEMRDAQIEAFREQTGSAIDTIERQSRLIKGMEEYIPQLQERIDGLELENKRLRLDDAERRKLREKASKDALTQLLNRGGFLDVILGEEVDPETLSEHERAAQRALPVEERQRDAAGGTLDRFQERRKKAQEVGEEVKQEYCVMILDIDHFKRFNDRYGHAAGDRALVTFAQALDHFVRERDVVARYGGEEFVIQFTTRNAGDHVLMANRLLSAIHQLRVTVEEPGDGGKVKTRNIPITASIGMAKLRGGDDDWSSLLNRADLALYVAKTHGRDQVVTVTQDESGSEYFLAAGEEISFEEAAAEREAAQQEKAQG